MENLGDGMSKKRSYDAVSGTADKEDPSEQEVAAMSRSERKRHREKKRRSDVNKGFDELMALLLEIDPEVRADAEERASKGQCKRSLGAHEDNVLSRVDLIGTSVRVLKRVHHENEKHKKMIEDLLKNKGDAVMARPSTTAAALGHGAAGNALSNLEALANNSIVDRTSLLQKSALGLAASSTGAPAAAQGWDPAAQLRARANVLNNLTSGSLRDYSTADLLALRAATNSGRTGPLAGAVSAPASDAALLGHLSNQSVIQRNLFVQNMLQNSSGNLMTESLYGALQNDSGPTVAETLYSALQGNRPTPQATAGALHIQKEEELRKLRAAGQM